MNDGDYDAQRRQVAELITTRLNELATESGIILAETQWDYGQKIAQQDNHLLQVRTSDRIAKGRFSDEQLADYQGRVGTGKTDAVLHEILRKLSE